MEAIFLKPKRITNPGLLEYIKTLPCLCCTGVPSDPHHVKTVGSGGDDTVENVMPLCRIHHTEWHAIGPSKMAEKYASIKHWLILVGKEDLWKRSSRHSKKNLS